MIANASLLRRKAFGVVGRGEIRRGALRTQSFHFASTEYAKCFLDLPQPDPTNLRKQSIEYLDSFDPKRWYDDPISSLLKGISLAGSSDSVDTIDALGTVNGQQVMASPEQVDILKEHIQTFVSPYTDLRQEMRAVEQRLLTDYAGLLIGNQCIDFQKQDGITEIEESIMANAVERQLNDLLLRDEALGVVNIDRKLIYVSCVSNFSNFLDLFRKSIRSLEVGVPIVVLGRSNTAQHCYRWAQLLVELMEEQNVDTGMVTFLSCSLDDIKEIMRSCRDKTGNLYTTCSRELAAAIKSDYPNTVASTGGPNTLVTTELTDAVKQAIQMSASIESSGQCTALRHCVVPLEADDADLESVFESIQEIENAPLAVKGAVFDGIFRSHQGSATPDEGGYVRHAHVDAYYKIGEELPPTGIKEWWRRVIVDFSKLDTNDSDSIRELSAWLNRNQPISLAVNGPRKDAIKLGLELFNKTGMVVNTIGSIDDAEMPPAMTCQARPQEAEVFGEFPPRAHLDEYTRFPVVVPSSNPSYGATYSKPFLEGQTMPEWFGDSTRDLLGEVSSPSVRGYCVTLVMYLQDVARSNPKAGFGKSRTAVWGLQRPPLGTKTILRCSPLASWDSVCPIYVLFHTTNARPQVELSVDPTNTAMICLCRKHDLPHVVESCSDMQERSMKQPDSVFNTVIVDDDYDPTHAFPMVGNFVSIYLPLGHIKSTKPNDQEFALMARLSKKWLNTLF